MLFGGIVLGLVLGLLSGGHLANIGKVRLRWAALIFVAVLVRYGAEALITRGFAPAITLQVPLLVGASAILLVGLWANRRLPGMAIAFVGVLSNAIVLFVNGGRMPIYLPSLTAAGFKPEDVSPALHIILPPAIDLNFLLHLGPFADILPVPLPIIANVDSIGDVLIAFGLAFFLFAIVQRQPTIDDWADEGNGAGPTAEERANQAAASNGPASHSSSRCSDWPAPPDSRGLVQAVRCWRPARDWCPA